MVLLEDALFSPGGFYLAPNAFSIYMNPLRETVGGSGVWCSQYTYNIPFSLILVRL